MTAPRKRQRASSPAAAAITDVATSSNLPRQEVPVAGSANDPALWCTRVVDSAPFTDIGCGRLHTYHRLLAADKFRELSPEEKKELRETAKYFRTIRKRQLEVGVPLPSEEQCNLSSIGLAFGIYRVVSDSASHWTGEQENSTISRTISADTPDFVALHVASAAGHSLQPPVPAPGGSHSRLGVLADVAADVGLSDNQSSSIGITPLMDRHQILLEMRAATLQLRETAATAAETYRRANEAHNWHLHSIDQAAYAWNAYVDASGAVHDSLVAFHAACASQQEWQHKYVMQLQNLAALQAAICDSLASVE